jgi:capsular polysaccharide biosynthesis protein
MNLFDYLKIVRRRAVLILTIIIVTCAVAGVIHSRIAKPVYQASSKIIVNQSETTIDGQQLIDQSKLAVNIMFINTYKELIKTPPVLEEVVKLHPGLGITADELAGKMTVASAQGSQIMTITVEDGSYERASNIVNALTKVFKEEIPKIMRIENIEILSESNPLNPTVPQETSLVYVLLISVILSGTLGAMIAFMLEFFDGRMREPEEIETLLGVTVLASVGEIKKSQLNNLKTISSFKRVGEEKHVHAHG